MINLKQYDIADSLNVNESGSKVILLDVLADDSISNEIKNYNIFLINQNGGIEWQIKVDEAFDTRAPFTGIAIGKNSLNVYRWDGTEYLVDIKTGHATPSRLMK